MASGLRRGGEAAVPGAVAGPRGLLGLLLVVAVGVVTACTSGEQPDDPQPQTTHQDGDPAPADEPVPVEAPATPSAPPAAVVALDADLGRTWSRVPHDEEVFGPGRLTAVTAGGPGLVAVGVDDARGTPAVWTSSDGIGWERQAQGDDVFDVAGSLTAVVAGGPGLVAVGSDEVLGAAAVWISTDAVAWQRIAHDEAVLGGQDQQEMRAVTVTDHGLVAVGFDAGVDAPAVWVTEDGGRWERIAPDPPGQYGGGMAAVIDSPHGLVAVGQFDGIGAVWTSPDARSWSLAASGDDLGDVVLSDVAASDAGVIAVGSDLYQGAAVAASSDGRRWSRVAHDEVFTDGSNWVTMSGVTSTGSGLVAIGAVIDAGFAVGQQAAAWTSTDGASWERVPLPEDVFGADVDLAAVTPGGPGLVVVGTDLVRDRPAVWVSPADPDLPAPVDPLPTHIDLDTLRPEQLTSPAHVCLDVRDAPRWIDERGATSEHGGRFAWSFSEQLDPLPPDANMLMYSLAYLGQADLTGDGREELVVYATCSSGVGGSPHTIAVYTPDVGEPRLLDVLHDGISGGAYGDWLVDLDIGPGVIEAVHGTAGFDSPSDTVLMTRVRFRWDGGLSGFVEEPTGDPTLVLREAFDRVPLAPGWPGDGPVPDGDSLPGQGATERELSAFMTPSTNIACQFHSSAIACVVRSGLSPPPRGSCTGQIVVFLHGDDQPGLSCWEGGPFPESESLAVLEYGSTWQHTELGLSCTSQETGLTCTNLLGHGFFLSRALWEAW